MDVATVSEVNAQLNQRNRKFHAAHILWSTL